ncbi:hypothetical protein [Bradyrhizobium sp. ORS 111]|uniref:hypothetical protein n=1 Tax=Bradyrhizobium sp. ORS 111 TaxID=1685958 RepID=UPI00388EBE6A
MGFPLVQLAAVIFVIFLLHAADDNSFLSDLRGAGQAGGRNSAFDFGGLHRQIIYEVLADIRLHDRVCVSYVLVDALDLRHGSAVPDRFCGPKELWSRNPIARSRGIAAYRAWLPLERIRPAHISQQAWEEQFAWPPHNKPPYLPLGQRVLRASVVYTLVVVLLLVGLQFFTPFHVFSWLVAAFGYKIG